MNIEIIIDTIEDGEPLPKTLARNADGEIPFALDEDGQVTQTTAAVLDSTITGSGRLLIGTTPIATEGSMWWSESDGGIHITLGGVDRLLRFFAPEE